jgi:hypothetical protein
LVPGLPFPSYPAREEHRKLKQSLNKFPRAYVHIISFNLGGIEKGNTAGLSKIMQKKKNKCISKYDRLSISRSFFALLFNPFLHYSV